jgi:hypothetical protein
MFHAIPLARMFLYVTTLALEVNAELPGCPGMMFLLYLPLEPDHLNDIAPLRLART